jgi:hypothetical protein
MGNATTPRDRVIETRRAVRQAPFVVDFGGIRANRPAMPCRMPCRYVTEI